MRKLKPRDLPKDNRLVWGQARAGAPVPLYRDVSGPRTLSMHHCVTQINGIPPQSPVSLCVAWRGHMLEALWKKDARNHKSAVPWLLLLLLLLTIKVISARENAKEKQPWHHLHPCAAPNRAVSLLLVLPQPLPDGPWAGRNRVIEMEQKSRKGVGRAFLLTGDPCPCPFLRMWPFWKVRGSVEGKCSDQLFFLGNWPRSSDLGAKSQWGVATVIWQHRPILLPEPVCHLFVHLFIQLTLKWTQTVCQALR